jgi:hypothetical protein
MLPIHRGDELAAIELGKIQDRKSDVGREEFLCPRYERTLGDRQQGPSKDEIDFDLDPLSVSLDKQLDVFAPFPVGR